MQTAKRSKGFTLIELLVVIAIIGMLSSIVLASLNSARTKGQDAARIQNVKALKTAMELYYNDNNMYPQYGSAGTGYYISNLSSYLVPNHIPSIPANLIADGSTQYVWGPAGTYGYGLYVYTAAGGWCKTGVQMHPGWWGTADCNF